MTLRLPVLVAAAALLAACDADPQAPDAQGADALCDRANARPAECFPQAPASDACHGGTAQRILDASCDELAAADTKADGGWLCFWNPWLCAGGGGGEAADTYTVFVGASRCGSLFGSEFDDCTYYYSSSCTEVALFKGGAEVDRQFTSTHGNVRFEVSEPGDYEVRLLDRSGEVATQIKGSFEYRYEPAVEAFTVGEADEVRVGFDLPHASEATPLKQCAPVTVDLTVEDGAGGTVDSKAVEWARFVRFLHADGTVGVTRPFSIHPDATGEADYVNRTTFHRVFAGEHTVEFVRMDIPEWRQENNPDYAALLDRYAVESVPPAAGGVVLDPADVPEGAHAAFSVVDPLAQ